MMPLNRAFPRWWRALSPMSPLDRLAHAVAVYRHDLAFVITSTEGARESRTWVEEAQQLLDAAEASIRTQDSERGWRQLLAAQRLELHGLRALGTAAFRARAGSIRAEALAKLRSWRREHVDAMSRGLPSQENPPVEVTDTEFAAATETALLLHEHFANEAVKDRAARSQFRILLILAVVEVVLILGLVSIEPNLMQLAVAAPHIVIAVLLFGLLGAVFSALISLAGQSAAQRIPEQTFTYRITLARQAVGGISALAVYVLLASGFVRVGTLAVETPLMLLAAFASGFSERLVLRTLERFSGAASGGGAAGKQ